MIAALIGVICVAVIVAFVARSKNRDFWPWFFYGLLLGVVALPHALIMGRPRRNEDWRPQRFGLPERERPCPHCGALVSGEALICRYCHRSLFDPTRDNAGPAAGGIGESVRSRNAAPKVEPETETEKEGAAEWLDTAFARIIGSEMNEQVAREFEPPPPQKPQKQTEQPAAAAAARAAVPPRQAADSASRDYTVREPLDPIWVPPASPMADSTRATADGTRVPVSPAEPPPKLRATKSGGDSGWHRAFPPRAEPVRPRRSGWVSGGVIAVLAILVVVLGIGHVPASVKQSASRFMENVSAMAAKRTPPSSHDLEALIDSINAADESESADRIAEFETASASPGPAARQGDTVHRANAPATPAADPPRPNEDRRQAGGTSASRQRPAGTPARPSEDFLAMIKRALGPQGAGRDIPADAQISATGELVAAVQQRLRERGYNPGSVDGLAGPRTRTAISEFRKSVGLPGESRIDMALMERLGILGPEIRAFED